MASGKNRVLRGHQGAVEQLVFSPDGHSLASAGRDHDVWLWDVRTAEGRALRGHSGAVEAIAFSLDDGLLVSSSQDTTIRLWSDRLSHDAIELRAWLDRATNGFVGPDNQLSFPE